VYNSISKHDEPACIIIVIYIAYFHVLKLLNQQHMKYEYAISYQFTHTVYLSSSHQIAHTVSQSLSHYLSLSPSQSFSGYSVNQALWESYSQSVATSLIQSLSQVVSQTSVTQSVRYSVGMYRVQFLPGTEYRVLRQFFTGSGYRVFNKLEKVEEK